MLICPFLFGITTVPFVQFLFSRVFWHFFTHPIDCLHFYQWLEHSVNFLYFYIYLRRLLILLVLLVYDTIYAISRRLIMSQHQIPTLYEIPQVSDDSYLALNDIADIKLPIYGTHPQSVVQAGRRPF